MDTELFIVLDQEGTKDFTVEIRAFMHETKGTPPRRCCHTSGIFLALFLITLEGGWVAHALC